MPYITASNQQNPINTSNRLENKQNNLLYDKSVQIKYSVDEEAYGNNQKF